MRLDAMGAPWRALMTSARICQKIASRTDDILVAFHCGWDVGDGNPVVCVLSGLIDRPEVAPLVCCDMIVVAKRVADFVKFMVTTACFVTEP
jgi:hypothetical protein